MKLVGRDEELAVVERAVDEVRAGAGRVLGVLGEAGIGKSALLAALSERAAHAGVLVLDGRGVEQERDVPFGVAVEALDGQLARLASGSGALARRAISARSCRRLWTRWAWRRWVPGSAFGVTGRLRALVEQMACERPVALLVDDLHWADEASIELVLHLLRHPPAGPHLLVFASRPVEPMARVLDAARRAPAFEALRARAARA